jgi:hypothetical protein
MNEEDLLRIKTKEKMQLYLPWLEHIARREACKVLGIKRFEIFSLAEISALIPPKTISVELETRYRQGYKHGYIDALDAIPSKNLIAKVRAFFEREIMPWSYIRTGNLIPPPTFK